MRRGLRVFVSGIVLAAFTLAGVAVASAQEPAKVILALEGEAAIITTLIKPDKTADFDAVIAKYREAFAKSDSATRKQQLAGIKFFKSSTPLAGNAAYVFYVDPVVKGEEYDITRIVNEVFPSEATDIYNKYKDSFVQRQIIYLSKVQ